MNDCYAIQKHCLLKMQEVAMKELKLLLSFIRYAARECYITEEQEHMLNKAAGIFIDDKREGELKR